MKHSPAPFHIVRHSDGWAQLDAADNSWLGFARVVVKVDGKIDEVGEANLRLFQYAPDILKAAKELLKYVKAYVDSDELGKSLEDNLEHAINLIEGDPNA